MLTFDVIGRLRSFLVKEANVAVEGGKHQRIVGDLCSLKVSITRFHGRHYERFWMCVEGLWIFTFPNIIENGTT